MTLPILDTFEIQKAIYARLTQRLTVPVFDDVPQDSPMPYVVIGEGDSEPFDTDDSIGFETDFTVHVWSAYSGRKEVKQIMAHIYDALHRYELSIHGMHTVDCVCEYQDTFLDPDGVTRHGVMRFRLTTESELVRLVLRD